MEQWLSDIKNWVEQTPILSDNIKFFGILLLAVISYLITKKILVRFIRRMVESTKSKYDDVIFSKRLLSRVSLIFPLLLINDFTFLLPETQIFLRHILQSVLVLIFVLVINSAVTAAVDLYSHINGASRRPIKGYAQVIKIFVSIFGVIITIGIMTGVSVWTLVTGLSALTAILLLVFRDTLLSFVASIQISAYDLVEVGDWITVPQFNADGDVIDIELHTIKVQNFDKTITVIPTYRLIEDSFKNWRGMQKSGGRRIKRSVKIDISTIKFCDDALLDKLEKINLISDYVKKKRTEVAEYNASLHLDTTIQANGRRLTNIGTLRAYLTAYLQNFPGITNDMTLVVRQLDPAADGLPIEIYCFTETVDWSPYENIQSDIFDHIYAILSVFELRIFQNPSGNDFSAING